MTRRIWWTWLFGGAAAGQETLSERNATGIFKCARTVEQQGRWPDLPLCDPVKVPAWLSGPALNNQCPVCGTMTPPFVWKPDPDVMYMRSPKFELKNGVLYPIPEEPYRGPEKNWVACAHCSAVFQQKRAEEKP